MKIPLLYNEKFHNFNRDVLPLYGKNTMHDDIKFKGVDDFCKKTFEYIDDKNAIIVFPDLLNFEIHDSVFNLLNSFNDKVYAFSNDINDCDYYYKDNVILYRTALLKSKKKKTEFSFPAFCEDSFKNTYVNNISIGYCGHLLYGREKIINKFRLLKFKTNFIIRNKLLTGTKDLLLKKEFLFNIENNLFTVCYRGAGNYCYRFYETLMMGRIPILINTDRDFIFENDIHLNEVAIVLNGNESISELEIIIKEFVENNNIIKKQKFNREVWERYCSPIGFLKQFIKNI